MNGAGLDEQLDELGFSLGSVCEAIITTLDPEGSPSASPMGVIRVGPETIEIKPFKTSSTYNNLLAHPRACINITGDPALYLVTAFKHETFKEFSKPVVNEDLRLEPSDAHVFVGVQESSDISEIRSRFKCGVNSIEVVKPMPKVFSRGRAEAIEAIVYATRIEVFSREGNREHVERLISRFYACKEIVGRVSSPGSTEARIIQELERLIGTWRERAWR